MIPPGKIGELAALTLPEIIRPRQILTDKARTPVGYTMDCMSPTPSPSAGPFRRLFGTVPT